MLKLNFNSRQEIANSAKNAFSINFPFYVFALGILLAFSAFQCDDQGCDPPIDECEIVMTADVVVEQVVCGVGVWDNLWFNDGSNTYLQPYSLDEYAKADIENMEIKDKMSLKIHYQYAKKDNRYDDIVICLAYPGPSEPIKIISIEIVNN
ncbi:hypothetical protein V9L05_19610 [Bernardetia sp. Wsw4-3y2]|uniref:hypothetical protein n=1 Tax=Bernardetia sp. Wsw4-3y2 TaxID=3127471 RepID=UPI0030D37695